MAGRRPYLKERLLLYLRGKEVIVSGELVFAPREITQEGIAEALGIGRNNVPRLVRPLIEEGYVREWKARVNGHSHRRKVYTLTPKGYMKVRELNGWLGNFETYRTIRTKV